MFKGRNMFNFVFVCIYCFFFCKKVTLLFYWMVLLQSFLGTQITTLNPSFTSTTFTLVVLTSILDVLFKFVFLIHSFTHTPMWAAAIQDSAHPI